MATVKSSPSFQVGDRVAIRHSDSRARIVEYRGPLGPGGMQVYRVRIARRPKSTYIELCENQLVPIPTAPRVGPSPLRTIPQIQPRPSKINARNGKAKS